MHYKCIITEVSVIPPIIISSSVVASPVLSVMWWWISRVSSIYIVVTFPFLHLRQWSQSLRSGIKKKRNWSKNSRNKTIQSVLKFKFCYTLTTLFCSSFFSFQKLALVCFVGQVEVEQKRFEWCLENLHLFPWVYLQFSVW